MFTHTGRSEVLAEPPQQWTDRIGVLHHLRLAHELSTHERAFLTILRQQTAITVSLLKAGYRTPAISQAPPNMTRMMLRILLPRVDDAEIAAFDSTKANDLLVHWWAIVDATV